MVNVSLFNNGKSDNMNPMVSTKKKILEVVIAVVAGVAVLGAGFWLGWVSGRRYPQNISVTEATDMTGASSTPADFSIFWQAWQDINNLYLRNPSTTPEQKMYGAITGMVNSLNDPYTEFFSPADSQQFDQDITGNFGGIGAELGTNAQNEIVVIAPIKGTPAETAGLEAKDVVMAVNGTSTSGMTVDDSVNLIRGPVGTNVTLSIFRAGFTKPKDFTITRENIQVPLVNFEMKGDIAHITLLQFDQDAEPLFYQTLVKAQNANAKGIVLDLRDDPGGYLEVAVDLAGYFLKPNTLVVKEVGRAIPEEDFKTTGDGALANIPMAVLINGGSASASEILAGALHDDRAIPLVGTQSFGKGVVQQVEQLSDGSSIKITVAYWVTPSGIIIDHKGLTPDYNVSTTDADVVADKDPELNKSLEIVQNEIAQESK
jgi:carboxyl-terminal processing protease